MNKRIAVAAASLAVVAGALAGCSGSATSSTPETVYVQVAPDPAPAQEAPAPENDDALVASVMESTWNNLSYDDKDIMCWGYNNARSDMWESFNEGSGGLTTYEQWDRFFGDKCR